MTPLQRYDDNYRHIAVGVGEVEVEGVLVRTREEGQL